MSDGNRGGRGVGEEAKEEKVMSRTVRPRVPNGRVVLSETQASRCSAQRIGQHSGNCWWHSHHCRSRSRLPFAVVFCASTFHGSRAPPAVSPPASSLPESVGQPTVTGYEAPVSASDGQAQVHIGRNIRPVRWLPALLGETARQRPKAFSIITRLTLERPHHNIKVLPCLD